MSKDKKFLFDINIFDAPPKEEIDENLPPPPPVFSEDELEAARDVAFEKGRQQGQKEQRESREQFVAQVLETIAQKFSHLFAAEMIRDNIYEKEAVRLAISVLDILSPLLRERLGAEEVKVVIEKTLTDHRKTKEIIIRVPEGLKSEIDVMITRIRREEHEEALWRVIEDPNLTQADCVLEWGDGGAVRDSVRTARDLRRAMESLLDSAQEPISEIEHPDVRLDDNTESAKPAVESEHE
jgi:flagellar assembly protein FliH